VGSAHLTNLKGGGQSLRSETPHSRSEIVQRLSEMECRRFLMVKFSIPFDEAVVFRY